MMTIEEVLTGMGGSGDFHPLPSSEDFVALIVHQSLSFNSDSRAYFRDLMCGSNESSRYEEFARVLLLPFLWMLDFNQLYVLVSGVKYKPTLVPLENIANRLKELYVKYKHLLIPFLCSIHDLIILSGENEWAVSPSVTNETANNTLVRWTGGMVPNVVSYRRLSDIPRWKSVLNKPTNRQFTTCIEFMMHTRCIMIQTLLNRFDRRHYPQRHEEVPPPYSEETAYRQQYLGDTQQQPEGEMRSGSSAVDGDPPSYWEATSSSPPLSLEAVLRCAAEPQRRNSVINWTNDAIRAYCHQVGSSLAWHNYKSVDGELEAICRRG